MQSDTTIIDNETSTVDLYNNTANSWVREQAISLSDFTARPFVLQLCEPISQMRVLDLGCGEGYCSRELRRRKAAQVHGIDISQGMIAAASLQETNNPLGITYEVGCATNLSQFNDGELDLVVAVFLFNYLTIAQTQECMREIVRVLKPGGRFVFSIPHPSFPYMREAAYPFYFQVDGSGYFSQRDQQFAGRIAKESLIFFEVHIDVDDSHAAKLAAVIEPHLHHSEEDIKIKLAIIETMDARVQFFNAVQRQILKHSQYSFFPDSLLLLNP